MERQLPVYKDPQYGIEFIVDVENLELREKAEPENSFGMRDMIDCEEEGYRINYYGNAEPSWVRIVVPQFVTLDPEGMAQKYNKSVEEILLSTDFEIMVDQEQLTRRLQFGELPTIDIAGHTFYAEARLDILRPKDDFSKLGIRFTDLDPYYYEERETYIFPYDPKTHQLAEPDWKKIIEYPKDILLVEIPFVRTLDPVGWNRRGGWPEKAGLKETGLQMKFKAGIIPWHQAGIDDLIAENRLKKPMDKNTKQGSIPYKKRNGPKL
jgi:hypothetical protein